MNTTYVDTLGEIHPKWMIDLLAGGTAESQFKLLFWNGEAQVVQNLVVTSESARRVYRPAVVDVTITRAIYFPTGVAPYGTTREMFEALVDVIKRFTGLAETEVRLLSYAVLASWVVEVTEVPICVALVGPPSPERRQLLRLLRCLFRRALFLGEASLAGLYSLPMEIAPSILIERCELNPQFLKFLETTNSHDAQIVSKGRILKASCAKVLCVEEPLSDLLPDWLTIDVSGTDMGSSLPVLDARAQAQIVEEFQPKLEMFRLKNYALVRESNFDVAELSPGARDLARCLGGAVASDAELQEQLRAFLKGQDNEPARADSARELHSVVIEALLSCSHQPQKQRVGVAELTTTVNKTLERRGELFVMSPRAVGNILRVLGFSTQRLTAVQRGIILLNSVRQRIHRLASKYDLLGVRYRSISCAQCEELVIDEELIPDDDGLSERISAAIKEDREKL
jgi:hypothetical protein